ncbi:MAG: Fic family protein [Rhodoferax sp.]|nr:Fic family protein [Rhodoferax sp.]
MWLMSARPAWIWQQPDWPVLGYDPQATAVDLSLALRWTGIVEGKAAAIGLQDSLPLVLDAYAEEALATARMEGQALPPDAVRSSVLRHLGLSQQGPVDRHADGLVAVLADATQAPGEPLTEDRLCRWQAALFPTGLSGLQRIAVGRYRDHADPMQIVSGMPGRETVHYEAPPSRDVRRHMGAFLDWFAATNPAASPIGNPDNAAPRETTDGISRAAIAHLWFESIHPFEDGNGRLGRAVVDLAMAQYLHSGHGTSLRLVSLSTQWMRHRTAYYDALNEAQRGTGDVTGWVSWFAQQWTQACQTASKVMDQAVLKQRFWQTHASSVLQPRQRKVLQRLLDDGDGGFLGGLNADKYMKMTKVSKATATRDLALMVAAGQLRSQGKGRAVRYLVNVPEWLHGAERTQARRSG